MADNEEFPATAPQTGAGPRLKAARESAGLSLDQVAAQTKIPARMLTLIEAGDFAALPARTYATGFTRTYARALGLDDAALVAQVRSELGMQEAVETRSAPTFEPGDPSRVPSARFAWLAALLALVVIAAGLFLWRTYYSPAVSLPSILPEETAAPAPAPTIQPPAIAPTLEPTMEASGEATEAATAAPAPRQAPVRRAPAPRRSAAPAGVASPALDAPTAPLPAPAAAPAAAAPSTTQ
jgi:cytoskeletal protein RodZ